MEGSSEVEDAKCIKIFACGESVTAIIFTSKCGSLGMPPKKVGNDIHKCNLCLENKINALSFINPKFKELFCKKVTNLLIKLVRSDYCGWNGTCNPTCGNLRNRSQQCDIYLNDLYKYF